MPSTCCAVPHCNNRGGHHFPSDNERRKKWVIAIKRVDEKKNLWMPTATSVVCYDHFLPSDYILYNTYGKYNKDVTLDVDMYLGISHILFTYATLTPHTSLPAFQANEIVL